MRDIGDVDAKKIIAVRQDPDLHGVVEILRRLAVDGDDASLAQIDPPPRLLGQDCLRYGFGGLQHFRGEVVWNVELANDDLDVDTWLPDESEKLHNAAACGIVRPI